MQVEIGAAQESLQLPWKRYLNDGSTSKPTSHIDIINPFVVLSLMLLRITKLARPRITSTLLVIKVTPCKTKNSKLQQLEIEETKNAAWKA